jgi:starch synthase
MKILFAAAEALPFFKTGGLADVARALPDALSERGHDVRVVIPGYTVLDDVLRDAQAGVDLAVPWPGGPRTAATLHVDGDAATTVFIRDAGHFRTRRPYEPLAREPLSLGRRFAFFSRAVTTYARAWGADVVHLNDWQTGFVPVYALVDGLAAATVFSIHNLAYQGNFPPALLPEAGVPPHLFRAENGLEFFGHASFMKAAISLADRLATVSPSYAAEIRTPSFGAGLDGLLSSRRRVLHGVLNGIDTDSWNPLRDQLLPATYGARTLARKQASRAALAHRLGLDAEGPILGMVTRLAHQKGIDLLIAAVPEFMRRGCRIVILGSGDTGYEHALAAASAEWPRRIVVHSGFDEPLAHLIYAGADFFLMPSLYEPCGLGQMIAQRYGTPPIARRTGGLRDTIQDDATGFLFDAPTPDDLTAAVDRALRRWRRRGWQAMQIRCMREDHSWMRSAVLYERIYELAIGGDRLLAG